MMPQFSRRNERCFQVLEPLCGSNGTTNDHGIDVARLGEAGGRKGRTEIAKTKRAAEMDLARSAGFPESSATKGACSRAVSPAFGSALLWRASPRGDRRLGAPF